MATTQSLLDAVEAAIEGRTDGIGSLSYGDRQIQYMAMPELMRARRELRGQLERESRKSIFSGVKPRSPSS